MNGLIRILRNWTLPVAIAVGTGLYLLFAYLPWLASPASVLGPICERLLPITIFFTLLISFSKVDYHLMRLHRWQALVLGAQLLLIGLLTTAVLLLPSEAIASKPLLEAVLVCVIAPCAVASPIVTAKLGGDLTQMTTFVLASSLLTSLLIPIVFPMLEPGQDASFLSTFLTILRKLGMVLLLPLVLGFIIRHREGKLYRWLVSVPDLSFYCWAVSLAITSGITIKNILGSQSGVYILLAIALLSLLTALGQFRLGRLIGRLCGTGAFVECICPGQGMFQKNTGLAIWIAYTYLSPTSSIGAGCYVLWQNLINSYELWRHRTREEV